MARKKSEGGGEKPLLLQTVGRWTLGLALAFGLAALGDVTCFAVFLANGSLNVGEGSLLLTLSLLSLALLAGWLMASHRRSELRVQLLMSEDFFAKPHLIDGEADFRRKVSKIIRHRMDEAGVIAVLSVKDLNSDILSLYGADEVKEIDESIFSILSSAFDAREGALYAYSPLDGFLIYEAAKPEDFYEELRAITDRIQQKIRESGTIPLLTILIGAYPLGRGDTAEQGIKRAARAAKYNVATRLSSDVMVFSPDFMGKNETERDLSYELLRALEEGQLQVFYQPKYDLKNKRFFGAEALVRWNHPTRGLLPPSLFIPFAEQSGSIIDIDRYVFTHVCQDIDRWGKDRKRQLRISVNLSRKTVYDPTIIDFISKTLAEHGVNPLLIDMELTESLAAKDAIFLASVIKKIKALSLSTSIDDFGVGYSSLSSLKKLPFDNLKIDKSFVDDIEIDQRSRDVVKSVIDMAHALGMFVIVEGAETEKQIEILRKMGLDAIQGYYYSKPLTAFDYQAFLASNQFEKNITEGGKAK